MAILSPPQIRQLWIDAGGNPQTADSAVQIAITKSGGNTSAPGGLWGVSSNPNAAPVDDARRAIATSNDGRDWTDYAQAVAGGVLFAGLRKIFSDTLGVDIDVRYIGWVTMILGGWILMIFGLLLMIFGTRAVKQMVGAGVSLIGQGAGFGLGARLVDRRGSGVLTPQGPINTGGDGGGGPAPAPPTAPTPVPSPPPTPGPRGGYFTSNPSSRGISWTTPTRPLPTVPLSEGGPVHAPKRRSSTPRPVRVSDGLFRSRTAMKGGRHKA